MEFNDLLRKAGIDPQHVLILRHCPKEDMLKKKLPWCAVENPCLFNAYQQSQKPREEKMMKRASFVASFIGHASKKAIFVGLYSNEGSKPLTRAEFWKIPENKLLQKSGMIGFDEKDNRPSILWFDLKLKSDFYPEWQGKLIVNWPTEIAFARWADSKKSKMSVHAILEDSALIEKMPPWNKLVLKWEELQDLPSDWKNKLEGWRAIYFIFDVKAEKGYVGKADGEYNLMQRWKNYCVTRDGGNKLLMGRNPKDFRFSILEVVAHNTSPEDMSQLENSWKERLHTVGHGFNA